MKKEQAISDGATWTNEVNDDGETWVADFTNKDFHHGHGYVVNDGPDAFGTAGYGTIMAVKSDAVDHRINYYSNPRYEI